jgi:hypothetical protein
MVAGHLHVSDNYEREICKKNVYLKDLNIGFNYVYFISLRASVNISNSMRLFYNTFPLSESHSFLNSAILNKQTPWSESASELYRPSDKFCCIIAFYSHYFSIIWQMQNMISGPCMISKATSIPDNYICTLGKIWVKGTQQTRVKNAE